MRALRPRAVAVAAVIAAAVSVTPALSEPASDPVQISTMGPPGNGTFDATSPRVASGGLVVYGGQPTAGEGEVYGRRVDGSGLPTGDEFRITTVGADGDLGAEARNHAVAHNSAANEFLVVWSNAPTTPGDEQIKARRVSASGQLLGGVIDVSQLNPGGGDNQRPRVAYAAGANEYLVVWRDNASGEVYGQRLAGATGAEVGPDDFVVSAGPHDNAERVDVTSNPDRDEFLATWTEEPSGTDGDEVFARRVDAGGGGLLGDELELSETAETFGADRPMAAYSTTTQEYLVGWDADRAPTDGEREVYVQRVAGTGEELGDDRRISAQGADGDPDFDAEEPTIAWDAAAGRWLVAWAGSAFVTPTDDTETEIFARRLGPDAAPDGDPFRLTNQGPDGHPDHDAENASVAFSPAAGQVLVAWEGTASIDETQLDGDARNEREVFARRDRQPLPPAQPTPTPTPTPTPAPELVASDVIKLPSAKRCVKRRRITIRFREPAGVELERAVIRVNGKRVRTVRGAALDKPVKLRKLPKRKFVVKVKAFTTDDRSVTRKRRFRGCKKRR